MKQYLFILEVENEMNEHFIVNANSTQEAESKFKNYANNKKLVVVDEFIDEESDNIDEAINNYVMSNYEVLEVGNTVPVID